jgi:hypothetical protein
MKIILELGQARISRTVDLWNNGTEDMLILIKRVEKSVQ